MNMVDKGNEGERNVGEENMIMESNDEVEI